MERLRLKRSSTAYSISCGSTIWTPLDWSQDRTRCSMACQCSSSIMMEEASEMPPQCWQATAGTYSSPEMEIAPDECSSLLINTIYNEATYLGEQTG